MKISWKSLKTITKVLSIVAIIVIGALMTVSYVQLVFANVEGLSLDEDSFTMDFDNESYTLTFGMEIPISNPTIFDLASSSAKIGLLNDTDSFYFDPIVIPEIPKQSTSILNITFELNFTSILQDIFDTDLTNITEIIELFLDISELNMSEYDNPIDFIFSLPIFVENPDLLYLEVRLGLFLSNVYLKAQIPLEEILGGI